MHVRAGSVWATTMYDPSMDGLLRKFRHRTLIGSTHPDPSVDGRRVPSQRECTLSITDDQAVHHTLTPTSSAPVCATARNGDARFGVGVTSVEDRPCVDVVGRSVGPSSRPAADRPSLQRAERTEAALRRYTRDGRSQCGGEIGQMRCRGVRSRYSDRCAAVAFRPADESSLVCPPVRALTLSSRRSARPHARRPACVCPSAGRTQMGESSKESPTVYNCGFAPRAERVLSNISADLLYYFFCGDGDGLCRQHVYRVRCVAGNQLRRCGGQPAPAMWPPTMQLQRCVLPFN